MKASARSLKEKTAFDGWLTKQGGKGIGANWRRRWFILTYDKFLYYYKHPDVRFFFQFFSQKCSKQFN